MREMVNSIASYFTVLDRNGSEDPQLVSAVECDMSLHPICTSDILFLGCITLIEVSLHELASLV